MNAELNFSLFKEELFLKQYLLYNGSQPSKGGKRILSPSEDIWVIDWEALIIIPSG